MACDTDCWVDFDVNASFLDWQQHTDSLPLLTSDGAESKNWKPKPKPQSKTPTGDSANFSTKTKRPKWKKTAIGTGDDSDQEQLITNMSHDAEIDVSKSRDVNSQSVKRDCDSDNRNEKIYENETGAPEKGITGSSRSEEDAHWYSVAKENGPEEGDYLTVTEKEIHKAQIKENVLDKLSCAEDEVEKSLQMALEVINRKKTFLLHKLESLRKKKEREEKEKESKAKTPIQVLKSPRVSPGPNTDSENESDSVFVRKKVIKTDKKKLELVFLSDIEQIVTKAEKISLVARKVNYMTPFLVAKVSTDADSDEETPDLVNVLAVTIDKTVIVMTTDFKNSCLKSFRHVSGEVFTSVLQFDNCPWGITRMDLDTVIVSIPLANKICLVDIRSGLTQKETVRTKKQYYGLVSIGSNLAVATSPYSSPRSVDTIDLNGAVLKTYVIDTLLQQPSFICTTPSGSFVVSDLSKGTLLGVSNSLEIVSGFEREGEAQLSSTRGVTTNRDGDVFVVDYQQKKVKVFSGQGRFLADFLTSGDGLKYPYGVCFDDRGHVYVTDGGVIKVFSY